jgi:hypothetical protein
MQTGPVLDSWLCIGLILENSHHAMCAVAYKHQLDLRNTAKSPAVFAFYLLLYNYLAISCRLVIILGHHQRQEPDLCLHPGKV